MINYRLVDKLNIYDKLLFILIFMQFFGIIGDAFQPIRLFTVIMTPFLITSIIKNNYTFKKYSYEFFLYSFWILYGVITLLFSIYIDVSVKEIVYLLINVLSFFLLLLLSTKANNPKRIIILGWFVFFLFTVPIALYELYYDVHLPISAQEEGLIMKYDNIIFDRIFASVTFGNLNGYNTVLMFIFPFILSIFFNLKNNKSKIIHLIIILLFLFIIINNGSRAAIITTAFILIIFILFYFEKRKIITFGLVFLFLVSFIINRYFDDLFFVIINRFEAQGLTDEGRADILRLSINEFYNSYFFGVGAGNLKPLLAEKYNLENFAPHNMFIEIGVQYGFFVLLLFVIQFVKILRLIRCNSNVDDKFIIFSAILSLPLITVIDSSYILSSNIWMFIGSLYVISDTEYNKIEDNG